ncbi:MAG: serine/threonine-protein kinase [Halocynthiibacter sp.]|jgi:tRNA A-37 threonylcarbamoyl transferase component Bud32
MADPKAPEGDEPPIENNAADMPAPESAPDEVISDRTEIAPSAQAAPAPEAEKPAAQPHDESVPIGTLINNNYEIKAMIQAGGMGEVYRGENSFTGDPVAIKIVLRALAHDEKIAGLFRREARILCQLSDQAIVRYYNFVHDQQLDRFCLIMEFIDGKPLSDHVKDNGPISVEDARELIVRLAEGLGQAHEVDVVHRDLSPDNVMLRGGSVHDAVLIDFGIAKSTEMSEGTLHGQFAGKFKYISPEQLGHYDGVVGPRTDVYGLALLMAAALQGEPLDMGSSIVEAVNARRAIPDLSGIDPALRPLLAHMLEPDPTNRPARMSDVVRLLRNPSEIPARYGQATPIASPEADDRTVIGGLGAAASVPPVPAAVPGGFAPTAAVGDARGVQAPPSGGINRLTTGLGGDDESVSPFGNTSAQPGAFSIPPGGTTQAPRRKKRKNTAVRNSAIVVIALGLAGFVADRAGLVDKVLGGAPVVAENGEVETPDAAPPEAAKPPPGILTRERFLAEFDSGACTYATRVTSGANSGLIEGYAQAAEAFKGLPVAYEEQFGARPEVIDRVIDPVQCAALEFARAVQAAGKTAPVLTLNADTLESGDTLRGSLRGFKERNMWVFLVSGGGGVYNLTPRLEETGQDAFSFGFGLNRGEGGGPTSNLIVAVASPQPLINAAAAADGALAAELLPLVQAEIAGRGHDAAVSVSFFDLVDKGALAAPEDVVDGAEDTLEGAAQE